MNSSEIGKLICSVKTWQSLNIDSYFILMIVADSLYQLILKDLIRNIQFCVYGIMNAFDINLVYLYIFYMTSLQSVDFFLS